MLAGRKAGKELISCGKRSLYFSLLARQQWRAALPHQCQWFLAFRKLFRARRAASARDLPLPRVAWKTTPPVERVMAGLGMILKNIGGRNCATFCVTSVECTKDTCLGRIGGLWDNRLFFISEQLSLGEGAFIIVLKGNLTSFVYVFN